MLEVEKLYVCEQYYLMLYPDKETATAASSAALAATATATTDAATPAIAATAAAYWSKRFDKPVNYCNPETPLLVLNTEQEYVEVLAGDKVGWIINEDSLNIKDISIEAA
jgi:hypothetical protein